MCLWEHNADVTLWGCMWLIQAGWAGDVGLASEALSPAQEAHGQG